MVLDPAPKRNLCVRRFFAWNRKENLSFCIPPKYSTQHLKRNRSSVVKPFTPEFRTIVFSMMRSVLKRLDTCGLYLFSELAIDSALASDTPTMPMK